MKNRLTVVTLALIGLAMLGYSIAPRAAVVAAQPTPQPSQAPTETARPDPTGTPTPTAAPLICSVNATALNVRTCPGVACDVIGWLQAGQSVTLATVANNPSGWAELTAGGWIHSSFINCEVTK